MDAVELKQVRRCGDAALQLVDMHDIEPVAAAGIVVRPVEAAEGRPQREPADAAHAVDADAHAGQARTGSPSSSRRARTAIRSSEANGSEVKMLTRRLRLA